MKCLKAIIDAAREAADPEFVEQLLDSEQEQEQEPEDEDAELRRAPKSSGSNSAANNDRLRIFKMPEPEKAPASFRLLSLGIGKAHQTPSAHVC